MAPRTKAAATETTGAATEKTQGTPEKTEGMTILEAFEAAGSSRKVRRAGWPKELKRSYVTIRRGETLPTLTNGKSGTPYVPSIIDVMAKDWEIINN